MTLKRACLAAFAALLASSVHAEELRKLPEQLDSRKAYVVVELGQLDGAMLPASLVLSRYDSAHGDLEFADAGKAKAGAVAELRQTVGRALVKENKRRLCVLSLEPGLWVVEGANDTAFSLGSSTLALQPGTVTDLGVTNVYSDFATGEKRDVLTSGRMLKSALLGGLFVSRLPAPVPRAVEFRPRTADDLPLPAMLAAKSAPVQWLGEVRFGNYMGGLVNRMGGRKARLRALAAEQEADTFEGDPEADPAPVSQK